MRKWTGQSLMVIAVGVVLITTGEGVADELSKGIIIRGIGTTKTCSADTVVPEDNRLHGFAHNLSVNCTKKTSNIDDYTNYTDGMVHTKFCVAEIAAVKRLAGSASVKTDPLKDNKYHCLVNNVKPKPLVGTMTPEP